MSMNCMALHISLEKHAVVSGVRIKFVQASWSCGNAFVTEVQISGKSDQTQLRLVRHRCHFSSKGSSLPADTEIRPADFLHVSAFNSASVIMKDTFHLTTKHKLLPEL